jgi:hypothetical protein
VHAVKPFSEPLENVSRQWHDARFLKTHELSSNNTGDYSTNLVTRLGVALAIVFHVDLTNGTGQITGTVSDGSFTSDLIADRSVFNATTNPAAQFQRLLHCFPPARCSGDQRGLPSRHRLWNPKSRCHWQGKIQRYPRRRNKDCPNCRHLKGWIVARVHSTGLFSGSFFNSATEKATKLSGALSQKRNIDIGSLLGTSQTGFVTVAPVSPRK